MNVWIVLQGEQCEGGSIQGVFIWKKDAEKCALSQFKCFSGEWELEDENVGGSKRWRNGCDFIEISKWKVS